MTLARYLSHFDASVQEAGRAVAVAGGLAGGCLLLLRLSGLWLGYSETRDLLQYLLIGGWMGLGLGAALARLPLPHAALAAGAVLALYACGEISVYAAHVLAQGWLWPVWLMLLGVAFLPEHPRSTPAYRVAAAWLVAAMLGASLQLLSPLQKLAVPLELRQLPLALPFLLGLVYILCALLWPCGLLKPMRRHGAYAMGHALALWVLALLAFHLEPGAHSIMMHHWKAFVESANMVRAGGWLLWDVPSQYGFLQTWLLAALPGDTVWQNFYVLLGGLQLAVGYAVFALLWWSYRGLTGFVFALSMAVACVVLMLPATLSTMIVPSTGAMRFGWAYAIAGYVFFLCRRAGRGRAPAAGWLWAGHGLWLLGLLWAVDSAFYVTVAWLPAVALLEWHVSHSRRRVAQRWLEMAALAACAGIVIGGLYQQHHGKLPYLPMLTAYAQAYQSFMAFNILELGVVPLWLAVMFVLVLMAVCVLHRGGAAALPRFTALACGVGTLWACCLYYVPFSEKYHITGTLPFVVLLSAMALCLLREGALEPMQARLFERSIFAFYGVMLFGTACLFDYSLYYRLDPARPLLADVTRAFPRPKADVLALLREAELPQGAALQLVYGPGELEDMYLREPATRPWVLPNTTVGFRAPLPSAMYERIARRRLRSAPREGWVLEAKEFPLEYVPPLAAAIGSAYQQVQVWEKGQWRLRRFERRP